MKILSIFTLALLTGVGSLFGNHRHNKALEARVTALEHEINALKSELEKQIQIDVQAPESVEHPPITVILQQDGGILINGKKTSNAELTKLVEAAIASYPDQSVVIRGDKSTSYKNIVEVIECVKKGGAWNIAFATLQTDARQGAPDIPDNDEKSKLPHQSK